MIAVAISSQAGTRAPRDTASSPATTPPPRTAAAHSAAYTAATGRCRAISSGGHPGGHGMTGTAGLVCETEATIMIRIELPMRIADTQARGRARLALHGVAGCSGRDEPVPVAAAVAELTLPARHFPV